VVTRFAKNLAYFLLGLLLADLGRRAVFSPLPGPIERGAAPLLAERRTCSVLFVGPSYVEAQIVPEAFNREAERIGLRARACKYGAAGMRAFELRLLLERLLSHDWPALEHVVIDITLGERVDFEPDNWLKPRLVEWHTRESIPWLFAYYERRGPLPFGESAALLWAHAKHLAAHHGQIGEGVERLGSLDLLERHRRKAELEPPRNGSGRARGRAYGEAYERLLAAKIEERRRRGPKYGDSEWALELRSLVRARDKEAFFLIAPVLYPSKVPKRAVRGRDRLVVLDFNDPIRFPELYEESARGNTSHLRGRGKVLYSELLARELKRLKRRSR